jgi:hypothetical protein
MPRGRWSGERRCLWGVGRKKATGHVDKTWGGPHKVRRLVALADLVAQLQGRGNKSQNTCSTLEKFKEKLNLWLL